THFDVSQLPKIMMVSAAVSVVAVLQMSRLLSRFGPARVIPPLYLASALLLAIQWYMADTSPRIAVIALYLHVAALNSILISGFWSVVNERFDPYTAKKVIPRLTAATTFGGVLGGLAASSVASAADTHAILLMLSAMHLVCAGGVAYLGRGQRHVSKEEQEPTNFIAPLKRSPLIRRMALLALLVATTAAVLDYILKSKASSTLADEDLITFFAYFYTAVGLGTFLLQSAVGNRALRWFGLGGTMVAWPLSILITGGAAMFIRTLVSATLLRASANLLYNSFFRAGFELLYTPISPADKRTGKVLIDVGADRSGDLLGGLLVMAILLVPVATDSLLLISALILSVACMILILILHRGYVKQLADNLRSGNLRAEELEVVDATTTYTVATTQTSIERDQLLRDIASYSRSEQTQPLPASILPPGNVDAVTESIAELRSGNDARIKRILSSNVMTAELLPHAIPLLADERVLREALRALRKMASSGAGQLVDELLNPSQHPLVRRRLPLVLAQSESPLAVQGLMIGLDQPDWNVRLRCAQGLETIRKRYPNIRMSDERLLAIAEREANALSGENIDLNAPRGVSHQDHDRVQFLFFLFSALYEPETIDLCVRALQSGDRGLEGTALEYLENILPLETWAKLQPVLAPGHKRPKKKRPSKQVERDLQKAEPLLREKQNIGVTDVDAADTID
ncbi:MAG: hypothetical protein ACR2QW_00420, partial [bacterium]